MAHPQKRQCFRLSYPTRPALTTLLTALGARLCANGAYTAQARGYFIRRAMTRERRPTERLCMNARLSRCDTPRKRAAISYAAQDRTLYMRSVLNFGKHILAHATKRANPILRKILKCRARRNPVLGIAHCRIIFITAGITYIFAHQIFSYQKRVYVRNDCRFGGSLMTVF